MGKENSPLSDDVSSDATPFLEMEPPPLVARGLSYLLIGLFSVTALLTAIVHVPETVQASFVLVPLSGADPVKAARGGTVSVSRAAEGATVAKGAVLFVIRSQEVGDRTSELRTLEAQEKGSDESLANARRKYESDRLIAEGELKKLLEHGLYLDRMVLLKSEQLSIAKEQANRARKLNEQGLASWVEYSATLIRLNQTTMEVDQLQTERKENRGAVDQLKHQQDARRTEFSELERSLLEKLEGHRIRMAVLNPGLEGTAGNDFPVLSPCAGTVLRVQAGSPGAVVREGDVLCELACSGGKLQAELTVPQGGVAHIKTGDPVKLLYDAFPYQRYGVRYGIVRWTSPASVSVNGLPAFRVLSEIDAEPVRVDGQPRPLLAGMGGTARVIVGRRSLISYAFEPLRQLRENFSTGRDVPK